MAVLQQVEGGAKVADVCRKVGIGGGTFHGWKKQYAGLGISELRERQLLREENERLKQLVAELSLASLTLKRRLS